MNKKIKIALLMGGLSAERKISFASGKSILKYLDKKKYQVYQIEVNPDLKFISQLFNLRKKVDLAFIALHGPIGEDGKIQSLLEILKIPYTFSGALASALAMSKLKSRQLFQFNKIKTPKYSAIAKNDWQKNKKKICAEIIKKIKLPCVIKPDTSGSSYGINIAWTKNDLEKSIKNAFKFDELILIEEYLGKKEISVPTIGNEKPTALPVIEIIPQNKFFDLKAKYSGKSQEICPAQIGPELTKQAQEIAVKVHCIIGARGVIRTDMMIRNNQLYVLETNTIPGLTSESLMPKSAAAAGISFTKLLDKIIALALKK
ncbi:MAG: D-alanine--D-alanine ligase [Patescibacteria group bacterium]